jgi:dCMP deaminase
MSDAWSDWDAYFSELAQTVAQKSRDPDCKVGAVIVRDELVVSTGYNGLARRIPDNLSILKDKKQKLAWICHAEQNAVCNAARSGVTCLNTSIYVNKFPCFLCLQTIIQSGIRRIATLDTEFWKHDPIDPTGQGKQYVITEAKLEICAPNFPGWRSAPPLLTVGPRTVDAREATPVG